MSVIACLRVLLRWFARKIIDTISDAMVAWNGSLLIHIYMCIQL